jgi:hypothetical protein
MCPVLAWPQHLLWFSRVGSPGVLTLHSSTDLVTVGVVRPVPDDTGCVRYSLTAT